MITKDSRPPFTCRQFLYSKSKSEFWVQKFNKFEVYWTWIFLKFKVER